MVLLQAFVVPCLAEPTPLSAVVDGQRVDLRRGDKLVLRYQASPDRSKPYVQELYTPKGVSLLEDAPSDHPWHHGLMLALTADGLNYWEEPQTAAGIAARRKRRQIASELTAGSHRTAASPATITCKVVWQDDDGKPRLLEHRTILLANRPHTADLLLTWESRLMVPEGIPTVELTGAHYHGAGLRLTPPFTGHVKVLLPAGADLARDGRPVRGTEVLYDTPWCGYLADLPGGELTIAMFGTPNSYDRAPQWFTMSRPFAYLSATLGLDRKPLRLERDKPLVLRYGLAAWDGPVDGEQIAKTYAAWLGQLDPMEQVP